MSYSLQNGSHPQEREELLLRTLRQRVRFILFENLRVAPQSAYVPQFCLRSFLKKKVLFMSSFLRNWRNLTWIISVTGSSIGQNWLSISRITLGKWTSRVRAVQRNLGIIIFQIFQNIIYIFLIFFKVHAGSFKIIAIGIIHVRI